MVNAFKKMVNIEPFHLFLSVPLRTLLNQRIQVSQYEVTS